MKKRFRKAVFIVTYRKEKNKIFFLLLKRKLHWKGWEFPKGGAKPFDSLLNAVKREAEEETGQFPIKIKSYNINGKYKYNKELPERPKYIGQAFKLFSVQIKNKKIKLDKLEHSAYKWLDFEKAYSKLKWPNQRICLNIVNEDLIRKI